MKYLKMLGLTAAAALALAALLGVSSASAAVLCSEYEKECPEENVYPANTVTDATLEAGTSSLIRTTPGVTLVTCTGSTIKGETTAQGSKGVAIPGTLLSLTFAGCAQTLTVLAAGTFNILYAGPNTNGTTTFKGTRFTVTSMGSSCVYTTGEGIHIAVMTSSPLTTYPKVHVNATLSKEMGGMLCPEDAVWQAAYQITSPKPLYFKNTVKGE